MSKLVDKILRIAGSTYPGNLSVGVQNDVPNAAGVGPGASVTTAVSFVDQIPGGIAVPAGDLPAAYTVHVTPNQDATAYVSGKTSSGFNVTLSPRLASATLAAGTFDVAVFA